MSERKNIKVQKVKTFTHILGSVALLIVWDNLQN